MTAGRAVPRGKMLRGHDGVGEDVGVVQLARAGEAAYVFRLTPDGTATFPYVSSACAEVYGFEAEEAEADVRLMHDAIHPEDRDSFARAGQESVERLAEVLWEGRILRTDGLERPVTIRSFPQRLANGAIEWHGTVRDRDPGVQEAPAAQEQDGVDPDDVLGMLGHDIGQPLAVIAGYADWGLEVLGLAPATRGDDNADIVLRRCFQVIAKQSRRLDRLRKDLLVTATAEAHPVRAEPDRVDVLAHLRTAADIRLRDLEVDIDCPAHLSCLVQPGHLDQMLSNLVSNAERFARSRIRLRAVTHHPARVRITVEDDGHGVPPELLDRLFARFSHEGHPRPSQAGTGLGLYIVRALAHANGGTVVYEPAREWTRFTISLPHAPS